MIFWAAIFYLLLMLYIFRDQMGRKVPKYG
jgi:hypothetical protein